MLNTLESLGWIQKERDDTYSLGMRMGILSALYFGRFDLIGTFSIEADSAVKRLNETLQLSLLDGTDILYLAKKDSTSPVRLATDPGMKLPAHATAMGKVHLSQYSFEQLQELYLGKKLEPKTPYTVKTLRELWEQITSLNDSGFIKEYQEAVEGFICLAAPIRNHENDIIAAVSVTMLSNNFEKKQEQAEREIVDLARRISLKAGFVSPA